MIQLKICRAIFIILSLAAIGFRPDSSETFFRTIFVFTAGFIYDYWSALLFAYVKKKELTFSLFFGWFGLALSVVIWVMSIAGLFGILQLNFTDLGIFLVKDVNFDLLPEFQLDYKFILDILCIYPILAALEIFNQQDRKKIFLKEQNATA